MRQKKRNKILSIVLILSMILSYVPEIPVHAAPNLTYHDTTEEQNVFGFSYLSDGEEKTMYLYNSEDGKVKLTGDILFTTASYGFYQVRHYDGYLELPVYGKVKQAILIQHGELRTDSREAFFDLRILSDEGTLYSFNAAADEKLTYLVSNVAKIDDVYYLTNDGKLGMVVPKTLERHIRETGASSNQGVDRLPYDAKRYWTDYSNLATDVSDMLSISVDINSETSNNANLTNYNKSGARYFKLSDKSTVYLKYTNGTSSVKNIRYRENYSDYVLDNSPTVVPTIDEGTNTLTIDNLDAEIGLDDESSIFLKTGATSDECLKKTTPTETTDVSKTWTVMDGHVIITLTKASASATTYNTLTVQSDSTQTISFDAEHGTIKTGYQDIVLYIPFVPKYDTFSYAQPIGYREANVLWPNGNVTENSSTTLPDGMYNMDNKLYGKSNAYSIGHKTAGSDTVNYTVRHWDNSHIISSTIRNEHPVWNGYDYTMDLTLHSNLEDNNTGGKYPGFAFFNYQSWHPGEYAIGDGLTSEQYPKSLSFSVTKDGIVYNHILNFAENRHYIYRNHEQISVIPMNFKAGETDTPYVYTDDEWQVTIYARYDAPLPSDDGPGRWYPVMVFGYAPNAPTTGSNYPHIDVSMKTSQSVSERLTDNGDGTYSRTKFTDDNNVWEYTDIHSIQIGDTTIEGSSLDLDPLSFSGYDMGSGTCVYRTVDYNNGTIYDIMDDGTLYKGTSGHTKMAENVVKVESSGKYLTSDGNLYDKDGNKLKENVINLTDNIYQTESGQWEYINTDKNFNLDRADEHNLYTRSEYANGYEKITYTFEYDESEITSVIDDEGNSVANGDTREYNENGTHVFTITNKYGETFEKRIIVVGFYGAATGSRAMITAVNGTITLNGSSANKEMQYKKVSDENWTDYTEPFTYDGAFYYREKGSSAMMKAELDNNGQLIVTDLSEGSLTPNDYFVNAVWDGSDMRYYDSANNTFKIVSRGNSDGTLKYLYPSLAANGMTYEYYSNPPDYGVYELTTNSGGPNPHIKPIYGFIGPEVPDDRYVNGRTYYKYSEWKQQKSSGTNMAYLSNFTLLAGPNGSSPSVKSEDVFRGQVRIEQVLDSNHMLQYYNDTTGQNTTFVKAFMDGVYNWLVTDTGQVLKSVADVLVGNQGKMFYDGFVYEEVADDVTSVDEDYIITTKTGDGPTLGYGKNTVKYYLSSDIDANGGNVEGAEESGDTIIASSGTGMNKRALASNGNYYVALDDENMISYDHIDPAANQLDYNISTTNWTNECVMATPTIGTKLTDAGPYGTHYELYALDNPNATQTSAIGGGSSGGQTRPLYNGTYRIDLKDNYTNTAIVSQIINVRNVDTVKPSVSVGEVTDGKYTFTGQDEEGTNTETSVDPDTGDELPGLFNGVESAVSGLENLYYSLDNTVDTSTWAILNKPLKYVKAGDETGDTDTLEVNNKTVYIYAKDNAGNMSDVKAFNIGIELTPSLTYKKGETDLTFYADDDENHTSTDYSYSCSIGETITDGYEKTLTEDTTVKITGERTVDGQTVSASKDVPVIVLKPGKPAISDIDTTTRSVTVTAGTPAHMNFKELWIKIDDGEPVKYTTQEKVITFTDYGYHEITAYQIAENTELAGGPYTFKGDEVTKRVEDPEPVTIYPRFEYEKGKTTVTFYANTDVNNDDDRWTYKYTVAGDTEKDGYTFEVTEDTTATLFAEVDNDGLKTNNTKDINIYVMDAEKPQISDIPKNGNQSTITAGEIENDTLEKLEYKIDDATEFTEINSGDKVTVPVGWHTIYAKQTTTGGMITENERRVYVADLNITHEIKHGNGKTTLIFEDEDPDTNPDLIYTYDRDDDEEGEIPGKGVITETPVTVKIKETDPQGNDDEDTVDLDIVKTEPPTIKVKDDKVSLKPGDIENATLIQMYISFDNEHFEPYDKPIDLEKKDVTVYTYQTVMPDNPGSDDDIVTSDTAQADIFKYDVEFVDNHGVTIADGYSHVVLTGTSVKENAVDVEMYTVRETPIEKTINAPGMIISFIYDGNPDTVTIYHLDAENENAELDKETLPDTPLDSVILASDHVKTFTGYKFKNAEPQTLTVTRNDKVIRLYYDYDSFDYVVHYVDKDGNEVAPDKKGTGKFNSEITEKAINVAEYDLDDKEEKTITIKADKPNEITFKYKKQVLPRHAVITGRVTDEDENPIVDGKVILKKKQGVIEGILDLLNPDDDNEDDTVTNADGWYMFNNLSEGVYEVSISDNKDKVLAEAKITIGKPGKESDDKIDVTSKADRVITQDQIDGDRFVLNVGQSLGPVNVTIYHLDAENNNAELDKETLNNIDSGSLIKASDHVKDFTGYKFEGAEPDELTITKRSNELRLYYTYADFDYIVHYVDEAKNSIAPDKTGKAPFNSEVTEKAIDVEGYELKDDAEKTITIEANKNEIWFTYAKIDIKTPNVAYSVHYVDEDNLEIAPTKQGEAEVDSEVTEKAIDIEGYELKDDAEKTITVKADEPNVIQFRYAKIPEPRKVIITGCILDEAERLVNNGKAILKEKTDGDGIEDKVATTENGCYQFGDILAGLYEISVYDANEKLLATADINISEDKKDDLITTTMKDEYVVTQETIDGDDFIYNVKKVTVPVPPEPEPEVVPVVVPEPEKNAPPLFSMYKEIVLKKKNTFTINLCGITKNATVKSKITGKGKNAKKVIKIKQKKNGNVVVIPKKLGTSQVTCSILQNGEEYKVVVNIRVLKQYKGTSKNFNLKKKGLVKTSGDLPEFNVYKRIVKGKKTKIKFTNVTPSAKVKFYVANKKEAKALKISTIKRKGKTATCTIKGRKKGWVHLTAKITQNGKTYYTRLLVRIDDRSQTKEEINKQIHEYLK